MKILRVRLAAALLAAAMVSLAPSHSQEVSNLTPVAEPNVSGVHDFDFLMGDWQVQHRVKRPLDAQHWTEFKGTCSARALMAGWANVEDHTFERPTGVTRAVGLRAYDGKTGQWAIWWVDGRAPFNAVDPPMKGRFENGVGTFYSDGTLDGKPIRTRFIWSRITPVSAHWEQAYSSDAGKTWNTNWTMAFQRVSKK
jgi:hypothetical protein